MISLGTLNALRVLLSRDQIGVTVAFDGTLATDKFKPYILATLTKILNDTRKALEGADSEGPNFSM